MSGGVSHLYLSQRFESEAHPLAVGAAGRGGDRRLSGAVRAGAGGAGASPAADWHRPVRFPQHPAGGGQYSGLPPLRRVLPVFETAIL